MSSEEFSSLIVTLVRITWFASACKLEQLTANADVNAEGTSFMKWVNDWYQFLTGTSMEWLEHPHRS